MAKHERHLRIIYTRVLERGLNRCVAYLLNEANPQEEKILQITSQIRKKLDSVQKVPLDSDYYKALEQLVHKLLNLQAGSFDPQEIQSAILRQANLLQKQKRLKNRKREKHKNSRFEDGN